MTFRGRPEPLNGNRPMAPRTAFIAAGVLFALAILAAACGGEADAPSTEPTMDPRPTRNLFAQDPDFREELDAASFSTRGWATDFSKHSVPYDEITVGIQGRDRIPPIDRPVFTDFLNADTWIDPQEPVIALEIGGAARAYPLQVLIWHEIVNDSLGGTPVSVTFCPLCNSAVAFDRRLDGVVYDFGTSGNLRNSDLIMWDRQTESWWQQFTGEAIVGELTGRTLAMLPASIISYESFKSAYPDGDVLSRDTGYTRDYGSNPYGGYDKIDRPPFLYDGKLDGRLQPKERVAAVTVNGVDVAFPFSLLEQERAVNYSQGSSALVVLFQPGTKSAVDSGVIAFSRDVGATGVFDPSVDGEVLTFKAMGDDIVDEQTGSVWNIVGEAISGPLSGTSLTPIVHANHFWFAWAAFKPQTLIYQGQP